MYVVWHFQFVWTEYQIANFLQMIQNFLVVRVQSVCNFITHASPFLNFLATFFPVTGQQLWGALFTSKSPNGSHKIIIRPFLATHPDHDEHKFLSGGPGQHLSLYWTKSVKTANFRKKFTHVHVQSTIRRLILTISAVLLLPNDSSQSDATWDVWLWSHLAWRTVNTFLTTQSLRPKHFAEVSWVLLFKYFWSKN